MQGRTKKHTRFDVRWKNVLEPKQTPEAAPSWVGDLAFAVEMLRPMREQTFRLIFKGRVFKPPIRRQLVKVDANIDA